MLNTALSVVKSTTLWILTFVVLVAAWYADAGVLNAAMDLNLNALKTACSFLPGTDVGDKVESALRALGSEKALLFLEVKLLLSLPAWLWRL